MANNNLKLALFDLDNTLLAGDSDFEWGQFLISKGVVDPDIQAAANLRFYEQYKAGTLDIYEFLAFQLQPLTQQDRATLDVWHEEFMGKHIRPIMTPAAEKLVAAHLAAGHVCALVTATNSFVTGPVARAFNIPHLIATIPAVAVDGRFTGQAAGTPSFREGKIARVDAWLESMGLWWGSFNQSWFYSDSHNDLPLLEKVSTPVVVDGDAKLLAEAEARGWQAISLR